MEDIYQIEKERFREENRIREYDRRDKMLHNFYWEQTQFYFYSIQRGWINQFIKIKHLKKLTKFLEKNSGIKPNSTHKRYKKAFLKYINDHFSEFKSLLDLYEFSKEERFFVYDEGNE
jgi:hypothetical protein